MMNRKNIALFSLFGLFASGDGLSLRPVVARGLPSSLKTVVVRKSSEDDNNAELSLIPTNEIVRKVAVTGATGKTGRLVVKELLHRNVEVVGLVRNKEKAQELFSSDDKLQILQCNLTDPIDVAKAVDGCDATIWCATGFADSTPQPPPTTKTPKQSTDIAEIPIISKIVEMFTGFLDGFPSNKNDDSVPPPPTTITKTPEQSIDIVGIPIISKIIMEQQNEKESSSSEQSSYPKVVMLSSAGIPDHLGTKIRKKN